MLPRSNCQSGMFRLQSGSVASLNMAFGLLQTGQGEPVEALRMMMSNRVRSFLVPSVAGTCPSCCFGKDLAEKIGDGFGAVFGLPTAIPRLARKHLRAAGDVEFSTSRTDSAPREERGDDGAGAGASYQMEFIRQHKVRIVPFLWRSSSSMRARIWSEKTPRMPPPSKERMRFMFNSAKISIDKKRIVRTPYSLSQWLPKPATSQLPHKRCSLREPWSPFSGARGRQRMRFKLFEVG